VPELPEVESIRRKLEPHLIGKTISSVEVLLPRIITTSTPKSFIKSLIGTTILRSHRIGKYLYYELDNGKFLHFHLRMTGRLLISSKQPGYACVAFHLTNNKSLWYADSRTLGCVAHFSAIPADVAELTDAVRKDYTASDLFMKLKLRSAPIKDVLLDQKFLAGIGNIYACEICFRSRVSPYRVSKRVKQKEVDAIFTSIHTILQEAIAAEGTTFSDFRGVDGKPGNFQSQLMVYGREGEPCLVCGTPIVKKMHHGRGTYHCPKCQK